MIQHHGIRWHKKHVDISTDHIQILLVLEAQDLREKLLFSLVIGMNDLSDFYVVHSMMLRII